MSVGKCMMCKKDTILVYARKLGEDQYEGMCPLCILKLNDLLRSEAAADSLGPVVTLYDKQARREKMQSFKAQKPKEIKEVLDQYVIGQDEAKRLLSVAAYNHYKRIHMQDEIEKSNVLMMGPTGSGKTLLIRTLAKVLDVPIAIADATTLTEAGFVGADVESVLVRLLNAAEGDIKRAEKGIVYIDEFDKLGKTESSSVHSVSKEGVQQSLLKLMEGSTVDVPISTGSEKKTIQINTKNILFICGGSFAAYEETKRGIGFQSDLTTVVEDKLSCIIPELMGRLPIRIMLSAPTKEEYLDILTKPKNSILRQYQSLFQMDGIELSFTHEALLLIVERTMKKNLGVRGLRSVLEEIMAPLMFELPSMENISKCEITSETVLSGKMNLTEKDAISLKN